MKNTILIVVNADSNCGVSQVQLFKREIELLIITFLFDRHAYSGWDKDFFHLE